MDLVQNSMSHLISISHHSELPDGPLVNLQGLTSVQRQNLINFGRSRNSFSWVFPFLWGRPGGKFIGYTCGCIVGPFLKGYNLLWVCEPVYVWEMDMRPWKLITVTYIKILSTRTRILSTSDKLSIYFISRNPIIKLAIVTGSVGQNTSIFTKDTIANFRNCVVSNGWVLPHSPWTTPGTNYCVSPSLSRNSYNIQKGEWESLRNGLCRDVGWVAGVHKAWWNIPGLVRVESCYLHIPCNPRPEGQ